MQKIRVLAKSLVTPSGVFVRGAVIEMSARDAASCVRDGNAEDYTGDAPLATPIANDVDHADEIVAAVNVMEAKEREDLRASLAPHARSLSLALDELVRTNIVALRDREHAAKILGLS